MKQKSIPFRLLVLALCLTSLTALMAMMILGRRRVRG